MNITEFIEDKEAVSPVIGVILMVAITVILAAVIGTFVLGLGDQVQSTTPSASFNFDYTDNSGSDDVLKISHNGGDTISSSAVNATVTSARYQGNSSTSDIWYNTDLFSSGDINAGTTDTIDGADFHGTSDSPDSNNLDLKQATVRIVWSADSGDQSAVLGDWSGPDA